MFTFRIRTSVYVQSLVQILALLYLFQGCGKSLLSTCEESKIKLTKKQFHVKVSAQRLFLCSW